MARIFLSYARDDGSTIANELANRLRSHDHQVFFDVQSIRAGTQWRSELSRRIQWADVMVVLVTSGSNDSDYVYEEVTEAANKGKILIPIQVEDTPLPVHLRGTWQAAKFKDDNYSEVLLEIERAIKEVPPSSNLLPVYILLAITVVLIVVVATYLLSQNITTSSEPTGETAVIVTDETPSLTDTPRTIHTPTEEYTPSDTLTIIPTRTLRPMNASTSLPTDIPEQAILLREDFEDGIANEFRPPAYHPWEIIEETDGNYAYLGRATWSVNFGSSTWSDYAFSVSVKPLFQDSFFAVGFRSSGIPSPDETHYFVGFEKNGSVNLQKALNSSDWVSLYQFTQTQLISNEWNYLEVAVNDNLITVTFNGITSHPIYDYELSSGKMYFVIHGGGNSQILFDNLVVWSLAND